MNSIGILGGGQLGAMLGESLQTLGCETHFFAHAGSTAHQRFKNVTVGDFNDLEAIRSFAASHDVITCEMEHVPLEILDQVEADFCPSRDVLRVTQHRAKEKAFLKAAGLPHAHFEVFETAEELRRISEFPCIVKTSLGGYDGLGQRFVDGASTRDDVITQIADTHGAGFVSEEPIEIEAEISCIVARQADDVVTVFPVFKNRHRFHVLDMTVTPTGLPQAVEEAAIEISVKAARSLNVVGLLTTEFFVTRSACRGPVHRVGDFGLLINEFAPRPHNSGHVTRKACNYSQFDALARILVGAPLTPVASHRGVWAMGNLLSDLWTSDTLELAAWRDSPAICEVSLYGKSPSRPRRKMGHVIAQGDTESQVDLAIERFKQHVSK